MQTLSRKQPSAKPDVSEEVPEDAPENSPEDKQGSKTGLTLSPRNKAMNLLALREHSCAELSRKLAARDYSPEEIEATVTALVADGLLSDERFAEAYIAARMRVGRGPVRIRGELKQRGVDADTIHLHLDDASLDWQSLARDVRSRKFGEAQPKEYKEKARQMRFLEYRGFTGEQIRIAVDEDV